MNNLQTFNFNGNQIRTLELDGMPYFVGKDVAAGLGYKDTSSAISDHVAEEDKRFFKGGEEDKLGGETPPSLGQRGEWLINESGLYSLILSSKLPKAKEFKRWVTSEVLPAIRKTGKYERQTTLPQISGLSPEKVVDILFRWKLHEKFPSLTFQQIDGCLRLIPLYPQITYVEISRAICVSSAMISLIKDYMLALEA